MYALIYRGGIFSCPLENGAIEVEKPQENANAATHSSINIGFQGTKATSVESSYSFQAWGGNYGEGTKGTCAPWYANDYTNAGNYVKVGGSFTIKYSLDGVAKQEVWSLSAGEQKTLTYDRGTKFNLVGINMNTGFYVGVYEYYFNSSTESDSWDEYHTWKQLSKEQSGVVIDSSTLLSTVFSDIQIVIKTQGTWDDYASISYASGSGTEENPFIIKMPAELAKLAKDSRSSTVEGMYYKLGANIDLSAHLWDGIGSQDVPFSGNFNGNYYCIRNLNMDSKRCTFGPGMGLFNYIHSPAVIQNLIIQSGTINDAATDSRDVGTIVGGNDTASVIKNCIVEDVTVKGIKGNASGGGIVGRFTGGTIRDCIVKNCSIISDGTAGGICGWRGTIEDCAVMNCTVQTGWSVTHDYSIGWMENSSVTASYANVAINSGVKMVMYGNESDWGNWVYVKGLQINNYTYPIQRSFLHIGGVINSQNVYSYLKNELGYEVA